MRQNNGFFPIEDGEFREWLCSRSLVAHGEGPAVRALERVRRCPELGDASFLSCEFLLLLNTVDLCLNPPDPAVEHIFSALVETIPNYGQFPADEGEFNGAFSLIENEVHQKISAIKEKKEGLPLKHLEYQRMSLEWEGGFAVHGPQLLFDIVLTENEIRQFLFAGVGIPLCYLLYFIALDEAGHFSPLVRQSAVRALRDAPESYLWEKFQSLRTDFLSAYPVVVPVLPDANIEEFARSMEKALLLLGRDYDHNVLLYIARDVLETMPDSRAFLHSFPLAVSAVHGDEVLAHQWYALRLRTYRSQRDGLADKRFVEVMDYSLPNSRGIPADLFRDKDLALPFIRREYLRSRNIDTEAEIRLRSVCDVFVPPSFVRTKSIAKAKDLILVYLPYLTMYVDGGTAQNEHDSRMSRDDIALLLDRDFDLCALTPESLLHAKIMLWYVEPIHDLFKIGEADEAALSHINNYVEGIYGKPLSADEAAEKARAVIARENESCDLLHEGTPQWMRLFNILVRRYTKRNTLTLWEMRGALYDMRKKQSKPFFYPITSAIGEKAQGKLSQVLRDFEKDYKWFKKIRESLYKHFYNRLDKLETAIDVCGWKEFEGRCLRLDRQCCSISTVCKDLTENKCGLKALTCKFWLCPAAQARAASTWKGRRLLAMRKRFSFWCRALNVPLKIRCSFLNSFDDKAPEPHVDSTSADWYDRPMTAYSIYRKT